MRLIGRSEELGRCGEALDQRRPVVVLGETGSGTTTLVRAAAAARNRRLVEGGALSTLSWLPFLPIRRALGREPVGADPAYVAREVEHHVGSDILLLDDLQLADEATVELVPLLVGRISLAVTLHVPHARSGVIRELADSLGFVEVELQPLDDADAAEVVRLHNPTLAPGIVARVVTRSGGNPLLLQALAASGALDESLERIVGARLLDLDPEVVDALELLAVAGRPLSDGHLPDLDALSATRLVTFEAGAVAYRHPLIGEVVAIRLTQERRASLHSRLARMLEEPGEAARHHAAAGEDDLAYEKALSAARTAERPGERAAHLEVAAAAAQGSEADDLRLQAAEALVAAGGFAAAESLLDRIANADGATQARVRLLRARGAIANNDLDRARELLDEGIALDEGDTPVRVSLQVERLELDLTNETAVDTLAAAESLAHEVGGEAPAELLALRGHAARLVGDPGWRGDVERAIVAARERGEIGLECQIAETALSPFFHEGQRRRAVALATAMTERARRLRLASWERRFRTRRAWLQMHAGRFRQARDEAESLLAEALEWERYLATYVAAQASVDLGLLDRAQQLAAELDTQGVTGHDRLRQALWFRSDLMYALGRPREAIAAADEILERFPNLVSGFVRVTRGWASLDVGLDPGPPGVESPLPLLAGARPELEGVRLLAAGRPAAAADRFASAARLWHLHHERGRLRCTWAHAESLRRAGDDVHALIALERAERLVTAYGHLPLLDRVRKSLRAAGVVRAAPRLTGTHGLTAREAQLLALAGEGVTDDEIGRRLGIARPTVVRTLRSARRKLGATTRAQAAAMAVDP